MAVVGRPNVGKSTLVNRLVGHKVSITSSRPQTTRNVIRGVLTSGGPDPSWQMVLVDTPGLHKPRTQLGERLNNLVYGTLAEADAVAFLVDASAPIGPGDRLIASRLGDGARVVVVVNKVDAASRPAVAAQLALAGEWGFGAYVPASGLTGEGCEAMVDELSALLPEGPLYFPIGTTTDQPEELVVAEIIREKFLNRLHEELPHSLVIRVGDIETRPDGLVAIEADVIVERPSQKGIVIGRGGGLLEAAGTEARLELEALLGARVHLALRVRVEKDWQRQPALLDRLGFDQP